MSSESPSIQRESSVHPINDADDAVDDTAAFYTAIDVDKEAADAQMAEFAVENMNEAEKKVCWA
jgi:hypothetical protein